jgi:hypothetical protein
MKNFLLLIVLYSTFSKSQNIFSLKSSDDGLPIKYAHIFVNNKVITSSDSLGNFIINNNHFNAVIKITAVGYKTLDSVKLNNSLIVFMEVEPIVLNEIVVNNKNKKLKHKLGKLKSGDIGIVCTLENNTISQVAKFFENKFEDITFLDKIRLKAFCSDKDRLISILIYSVDVDGNPEKILNSESIICNLKKGHNTYEVNLNQFNIDFPENGVFIVLNYVFIEQNKCFRNKDKSWYFYEPSIDARRVNNYTDSWYNLNGDWKKSESYSVSMELFLAN